MGGATVTNLEDALLDAEEAMMDQASVDRARRRVAARLDAGPPAPSWRRGALPVAALVGVTAAAASYALWLSRADEPSVALQAEPIEGRRPGMAVAPPPPTIDAPPAHTVAVPEGGDTGTLVGISIGGSCRFSVDGEDRGHKSSIRIRVPVGPHVVGCRMGDDEAETQTVMVKADKPGIASFKIKDGDRFEVKDPWGEPPTRRERKPRSPGF
jgi:hypothetical protein